MSSPPSYSPPTCAPSYSPAPLLGEERIQYTPRSAPEESTREGKIVRSWSHATLVLKNQDEGTRLPTYAQNGVISGEVGLAAPKSVLRVVLQLEGRCSLSITDGSSATTTTNFLSKKFVLWCKDDSTPPHDVCPGVLPFRLQFPETFTEDRRTFKLPPSFEATFLSVPILIARCIYTLRLAITLSRQYGLASWATTKSYSLILNYRPRTRARHGPNITNSVFASVKTQPDEWLQLCSRMDVRPNPEVEPIDCHLVVPTTTTYALADTIPFHIHLSGSSTSLRRLLPPTCPILLPPTNTSGNQSLSTAPIQVLITRQIVVEIHKHRSFRNTVIGTGRVWPLPPPPGNLSPNTPDSEVSVSWEGEVRCEGRVTVPGFNIGNLVVKDYIMLVLTPPKSRSMPLRAVEIVHPIRLVTDPCVDGNTLHPQDTR